MLIRCCWRRKSLTHSVSPCLPAEVEDPYETLPYLMPGVLFLCAHHCVPRNSDRGNCIDTGRYTSPLHMLLCCYFLFLSLIVILAVYTVSGQGTRWRQPPYWVVCQISLPYKGNAVITPLSYFSESFRSRHSHSLEKILPLPNSQGCGFVRFRHVILGPQEFPFRRPWGHVQGRAILGPLGRINQQPEICVVQLRVDCKRFL